MVRILSQSNNKGRWKYGEAVGGRPVQRLVMRDPRAHPRPPHQRRSRETVSRRCLAREWETVSEPRGRSDDLPDPVQDAGGRRGVWMMDEGPARTQRISRGWEARKGGEGGALMHNASSSRMPAPRLGTANCGLCCTTISQEQPEPPAKFKNSTKVMVMSGLDGAGGSAPRAGRSKVQGSKVPACWLA